MATAGYLRLRQICLVAPALEPAVRCLERVFGLAVCYRDPNVARYGLENALLPIGTSFVEVVAPTRPDTAAGRFLERSQGVGAYMVIFDCSDPERRTAHAQSLGIRLASSHAHPGYRGFQLHPKDCRAAMLEFDHTEGGEDAMAAYGPAGGTGWTHAIRRDVTRRLTRIELATPRPDDLAGHWSRILELPDAGRELATEPIAIAVSEAPAAAREIVAGIALEVADPAQVRSAARDHGLAFEDDMPLVCGVRVALRAG
jgi:hypothetical protein